MTGQTQTTVERIQREIGQYYGHGPTAPKISFLSQTIAAEIDRLTAERNEARAKLKECDDSTDFVQGLREAEQATLSNTQRLLGVAHTELAEARAALSAWRTMFPVNTPAEIAAKLMRGG